MAKTRRGRGRLTDMFKQKIASSTATIAEPALDKAKLRLSGVLGAKDEVMGRMDEQGDAIIDRVNPMFKKAGATTRLSSKFNRCVKSVKKTVRARKGSNKESAAIAICTKSVLQKRGRTMKSYSRKRLLTQKKFRGGAQSSLPPAQPSCA
jgi:hypothetical protein